MYDSIHAPLRRARRAILACSLILCASFIGCEEYVQPPSVRLDFPPQGTFIEGDLLKLSFSTEIVPETLAIRIFNDTRNIERELPKDAVPVVDTCTVATSPCDEQGTALVIAEDGLSATLYLNPEGIGKPDVPLLVEVLPGLTDAQTGARLSRGRLFNFQFKPSAVVEEPVPFQEGTYLLVAEFAQPLPNVLTLLSDVRVTDDGRILLVGAEADEYEGAEQSTRNPEELYVDVSEQAFVVFAQGRIRQSDAGVRFVETEEFTVELSLGSITVALTGLKITGRVVQHPEFNNDQIVGTLSYESILLYTGPGRDPFEYEAGSTTFDASQVPPEVEPEGVPKICGNPCGIVPIQCNIPEVFPPEGFCEDEGESEGSGDSEVNAD